MCVRVCMHKLLMLRIHVCVHSQGHMFTNVVVHSERGSTHATYDDTLPQHINVNFSCKYS